MSVFLLEKCQYLSVFLGIGKRCEPWLIYPKIFELGSWIWYTYAYQPWKLIIMLLGFEALQSIIRVGQSKKKICSLESSSLIAQNQGLL